jgi:hypothetical protein
MKINKPAQFVLLAAALSLLLSVWLFFFSGLEDNKLLGIYVGLWVPSILGGFRVIETNQEK